MTSCKTTANLNAIYNLKFYRKQKSWKLNAPIPKEKKQKEKLSLSLRNKLNETYLITDKVQDESPEIDPLNVAFFEPEKEQEIYPKQVLSQQWLEPVNIWPKTVSRSEQNIKSVKACNTESQQTIKKKTCVHERLEVLLRAAKDQDVKSESALDIVSQEHIPECFDFNLEEEHIVDDNYWVLPELHQTVWSEPWINSVDVWLDHDVIDGLNRNQARPDGDWDNAVNHPSFYPPSTISVNDTIRDSALDSSSEFMRGAHSAPHSSEIDIALPPEFKFGTWSPKLLRKLNPHQLVRVMSEHSAMIVKLMTEKGKRNERSFTSDVASCDEPTRDVGPFPNGDKFVAGSHLGFKRVASNEFLGRGRGRLVQNRERY